MFTLLVLVACSMDSSLSRVYDSETPSPSDTAVIDDSDSGSETNCRTYENETSSGVVETSSQPEVSVLFPATNTVSLKQGEPFVMNVSFGAKDDCGSYMIREMEWDLEDFSETSEWLLASAEDMPESNLSELTTPTTFPDVLAFGPGASLDDDGNVVAAGTMWMWKTPESPYTDGNIASIPSQHVRSDTDFLYEFVWNGSTFAPIGSEFVVHLDFAWIDDATGYVGKEFTADREITVLIVE